MNDVKKIETGGVVLQKQVESLVITNQMTYDVASSTLLGVKAHIKKLKEALSPQCDSAYATWQTALAQRTKYVSPYESLEKELKEKMAAYEVEQEAKRILAQEEARLRAKAETEKLQEEYKDAIDKAIDGGDLDEAEALRQEAEIAVVPPAIIDTSVTKIKGVISMDDYIVEITDPIKFLKAVTSKKINIAIDKIITWKVGGIKTYIKSTGTTEIPGISIKKSKIIGGKPS